MEMSGIFVIRPIPRFEPCLIDWQSRAQLRTETEAAAWAG